ncbi:sensor histidine kinase [Longibacter salinarum]|nr:HAMP domain-containing sensor histidine kinase [Longibacter salinarum]
MPSPFKRIGEWFLPDRASTQTWMVLTFALFVGMAVAVVALYVVLVLTTEMRTAMEQTLRDQAERVAVQIENEPDPQARLRIVEELSRLTDLHISVATPDTVYYDPNGQSQTADSTLIDPNRLAAIDTPESRFTEQVGLDGTTVFYAALYRPKSNLIIQVGQPTPPLYELAQRTQIVLVLGMVLALILSIIGSWIAAYQVTTPLKRIRDTASKVADGRITGRIRINSRAAEFQDVAESLNRASDAFREKIEELERLTALQKEFIGNVSHEVRNPIFAISGYLEALGTPSLTDDMRKRYAEKALINLERLQNLFNDLIEIARLEYREDLINRSEFDLKDLVNEVSEMLRPKAEKKGLDLNVDIPRYLVSADRNRIRQVLVNFIDNAIAYTDEGSVRCRVQRRLDKVRIEVVDTGKGIDEEHLSRIFDRFYRVDPDRSRDSGGTGLGLSIVKQILQAHGEHPHVESTKGRGTRFWFELPYAGVPEEAEPEEA